MNKYELFLYQSQLFNVTGVTPVLRIPSQSQVGFALWDVLIANAETNHKTTHRNRFFVSSPRGIIFSLASHIFLLSVRTFLQCLQYSSEFLLKHIPCDICTEDDSVVDRTSWHRTRMYQPGAPKVIIFTLFLMYNVINTVHIKYIVCGKTYVIATFHYLENHSTKLLK